MMFEYTKTIFKKTLTDLKFFEKIWSISLLSIYIAYLTGAIIFDSGFFISNVVLLSISIIYFAFYLALTIKGAEFLKSRRKLVKKSYKYLKYIINTLTLLTVIYTIWINPYDVHPFKLLATFFMILLLVVQLALEVSIGIVEKRFNMFIEAFNADIEFVTKPVNTVKNVFKKITGQDIDPEKPKSNERLYLDQLVKSEKIQTASKSENISSWLDSKLSKITSKFESKNQNEDNLTEDDTEEISCEKENV